MDDNMRNAWLDMISKFYTDLHNSDRVLKASNVSDKKRERLLKYFERLEELHNKVSKTKSVNGEKLLKNFIMTYMLLNQKIYLNLTFKIKLDLLEKEVMVI